VLFTTGIEPSTRQQRIPYPPDNRVPINVPNDDRKIPDEWGSKDWGKFQRLASPPISRLMTGTRGPESLPGNFYLIKK